MKSMDLLMAAMKAYADKQFGRYSVELEVSKEDSQYGGSGTTTTLWINLPWGAGVKVEGYSDGRQPIFVEGNIIVANNAANIKDSVHLIGYVRQAVDILTALCDWTEDHSYLVEWDPESGAAWFEKPEIKF